MTVLPGIEVSEVNTTSNVAPVVGVRPPSTCVATGPLGPMIRASTRKFVCGVGPPTGEGLAVDASIGSVNRTTICEFTSTSC